MSYAVKLAAEAARSLAFGAIGAGYMGIGTAFTHPIRVFFLQNLTDATLWFSLNGIDDHFPLPANGFLLLDVTSNKSTFPGLFIGEGVRLYVKQLGVPTSGTVYLSVFYGVDI